MSTVLTELRKRPLRVRKRPAEKSCALEHYAIHIRGIPAEAALGPGPVHPVFRAVPRLLDLFPPPKDEPSSPYREWRGAEVLFVSEPGYNGPVLIRGGRIDGDGKVGFGDEPTPRWELFLPQSSWRSLEDLRVWDGRQLELPTGWRVQRSIIRIAADGCYAFQLDGTSFRQVIEFGAVLQPNPL